MHRPVVLAALALASAVAAQFPGQVPALLPLVPPPVSHPAYAAQPLIDTGNPGRLDGNQPGGTRTGGPTGPGNSAPPQPDTSGPKLAGRDLKKAVEKVASLRWFDDMPSARAEAAAHNKPILWIQALGDLEGFA